MAEEEHNRQGEVELDQRLIAEIDAFEALARNDDRKGLLGHILVTQKIIGEKDLLDALEEQKQSSRRLGDILVARGLATHKDLMRAFSLQLQQRLETGGAAPAPQAAASPRSGVRIPIRLRLALVITLLIVIIMSSASAFFYSSQKEEFLTQTVRFGTALVANLSHNSSVPLLENDDASLHILLEEISKMRDIRYVVIMDKGGVIRAHSDIRKIDSIYQPIPGASRLLHNGTLEVVKFREGKSEILDFMTPVTFSGVPLGAIHVGISMDSLRQKIQRFGIFVLLITTVLIIIGIGVAYGIGTQFSRPIVNLLQGTEEIRNGNLAYRTRQHKNDELGDLTVAFNNMAEGLRKKEIIQDAFGKYVNPEIVEMILKNPDGQWFQGNKIPATIMFTDIRGFTSYSEKTEPEQVVAVLNEHFTTVTEIIIRNGGHVDKFIGDAVLAVFGAPLEHENHAELAVRTAMALQEAVRKADAARGAGGASIRIGIGINSGEVIAGNIGSQQRMEYTVIGDTVNLASRLTGLARPDETIISGATAALTAGLIKAVRLEPVSVKGKSEPVEIYRLEGINAVS